MLLVPHMRGLSYLPLAFLSRLSLSGFSGTATRGMTGSTGTRILLPFPTYHPSGTGPRYGSLRLRCIHSDLAFYLVWVGTHGTKPDS
jgi:hypothetical protein